MKKLLSSFIELEIEDKVGKLTEAGLLVIAAAAMAHFFYTAHDGQIIAWALLAIVHGSLLIYFRNEKERYICHCSLFFIILLEATGRIPFILLVGLTGGMTSICFGMFTVFFIFRRYDC
jgi:hypothetical protein